MSIQATRHPAGAGAEDVPSAHPATPASPATGRAVVGGAGDAAGGPTAIVDRFFWVIDLLVRAVGILVLLVLTSTVFASVVVRYFGIGAGAIDWIEESSRFLFIWLAFLGGILAMQRQAHIRIDLIIRSLPPRRRVAMNLLASALVVLLLLVIAWTGLRQVIASSNRSLVLDLPMSWVHVSLPLAAGIMALQTVRRMWDDVVALRTNRIAAYEDVVTDTM